MNILTFRQKQKCMHRKKKLKVKNALAYDRKNQKVKKSKKKRESFFGKNRKKKKFLQNIKILWYAKAYLTLKKKEICIEKKKREKKSILAFTLKFFGISMVILKID